MSDRVTLETDAYYFNMDRIDYQADLLEQQFPIEQQSIRIFSSLNKDDMDHVECIVGYDNSGNLDDVLSYLIDYTPNEEGHLQAFINAIPFKLTKKYLWDYVGDNGYQEMIDEFFV